MGDDALGAVLWVPAVSWAGYAAGGRLGSLGALTAWLVRRMTVVAGVAVLFLLSWVRSGRDESKL